MRCALFIYIYIHSFPENISETDQNEIVLDGIGSYEKIWERSFQNVQILVTRRPFC